MPPATHALKFTGRGKSNFDGKSQQKVVYFSIEGFKKNKRRTKDGKLGKGGEDQTTTTEKKYMYKKKIQLFEPTRSSLC